MQQPEPAIPFASFWMGGYEGADHVNERGLALDMNGANGHAAQLDADHAAAAKLGIRCIRESIGWRLAEPEAGRFDFARTVAIAQSARRHGLQVLWTLMHYGTPDDVNLLDPGMQPRFVRFAEAVAHVLLPLSDAPPVYNLVNEIGFLAWTISQTNHIYPYRGDPESLGERSEASGYDAKRLLVQATVAATAAVRAIDPRARFLQVEPVVHVVAPADRPDLAARAEQIAGYQWQVWDMLAAAGALDLIGVNHYHSGQWEIGTEHGGERRLDWHRRDPRRRPFAQLLAATWQRFGRPLIVAETSHFGDGRAAWLHDICDQVRQARARQVPVHGICLYPLVDRPDWDIAGHWHHSALWDVVAPQAPASSLQRTLRADYAAALRAWQQWLPGPQGGAPEPPMPCLLVFSHLRWNVVHQRPQHLLSRLSRRYRVLFVEEPLHGEGPPRLDRICHGPTLDVLVPHTDIAASGFDAAQMPALRQLLAEHVAAHAVGRPVVWFYTPMALPLLTLVQPSAVVYDCMDELSAFQHAPALLPQREAELLDRADLLLTGGPALHQAKKHRHPLAVCMPSSVDAEHFSPWTLVHGSSQATDARRLQGDFDGPRLGFFGVIDERLDIDLLAQLASAHPEWQIVMVGPVVKVDPATLPRHPNILWLGAQPYALLPHLLQAWDVALMPFAINAATRFISPTKTLEYMAGGKPIVSTPVVDVVGLYGHCVRIAGGADAFIAQCEAALAETPQQWSVRTRAMARAVASSSWDRSVAAIETLLQGLQRDAPQRPLGVPPEVATPVSRDHRVPTSTKPQPAGAAHEAPCLLPLAAAG